MSPNWFEGGSERPLLHRAPTIYLLDANGVLSELTRGPPGGDPARALVGCVAAADASDGPASTATAAPSTARHALAMGTARHALAMGSLTWRGRVSE